MFFPLKRAVTLGFSVRISAENIAEGMRQATVRKTLNAAFIDWFWGERV